MGMRKVSDPHVSGCALETALGSCESKKSKGSFPKSLCQLVSVTVQVMTETPHTLVGLGGDALVAACQLRPT